MRPEKCEPSTLGSTRNTIIGFRSELFDNGNASRNGIIVLVCSGLAGLIGVALYALHEFSLVVLSGGILISGTVLLFGAFIGLLFGFPRVSESDEQADQTRYLANTNFGQISGWLTKKIVDVGLTQVGELLRNLKEIAKGISSLLGGVVDSCLQHDPALIIAGDFNLTEDEIQELADDIGMVVMVPPGQDSVGTTAENRYDRFLVSRDMIGEEAVTMKIIVSSDPVALNVSDHRVVMGWFRNDARFRDRD